MYSTLRILRKQKICSVDLFSKGNSSAYHLCARNRAVPPFKNYDLWKRKIPLGISSITSQNFKSTDATIAESDETLKHNQNITESIPEPPPPLIDVAQTPQIEQVVLRDPVYERTLDDIPLHPEVLHFKETVNEALPRWDIPDLPEVLPLEETLPSFEIPGAEATFESIGLGGWGPIGIVQNCMEFLHISCDLPWWATIVAGTFFVRTLLFPLVIISQRNAAIMGNHLPEMQAIQLKMTEARQRGDRIDAARHGQDLMVFMQEKGLNPFKNMIVPLAQAPLFISFFMGLREMASLPVESLRHGGLWWFTDLTLCDQFYLLPIITSITLAVTIEVGTDAARTANLGMMKYVLRAMPIIIFPFTMGFPAAILVYWTSTNFISLLQVSFLRIPKVRSFFKIQPLLKHDTKKLPIKDKGFVKGIKESWTNIKITRELEDRERVDQMNFTRAGKGAVKKTYKFDPTRPKPPRSFSAIEAKKRD
ncbi:mitochondrial inner membrane protein OXA1L isoform X2 [Halyomorpha halys]|uniref:mitochondrial inner membrane protein OXA1L isoform X2 n=1 Tax=Halyomorpha halys TaxID=286706 RepID=UPI0006D51590|nr:mitochondrial inner membrane protein OXA1L isoform X2 [Halyomorpha halys]